MSRTTLAVLTVMLLTALSAAAQEGDSAPRLPKGFSGIELGDALGSVKDKLTTHPYFAYRGERDVEFLPRRNETLLDTEGRFYVRRGLFQFHEDSLYVLTLILDPRRIDYYSLFTTLEGRYGSPRALDPSGAVWENSDVRIALEKPLALKYIDLRVFTELREAGRVEKSVEDISREKFLELF